MSIHNVHVRTFDAELEPLGALIDSLAGEHDRLWPRPRWPALRLDGELAVGARGGHGPIRYAVSDYEPGRRACFRFDRRIFDGHHWFEVVTLDGRPALLHVLEARPQGAMRILWPLVVRWWHDALIEDAFDRAEAELAGRPWAPRRHGAWVRATFAVARRGVRRRSARGRTGDPLHPRDA